MTSTSSLKGSIISLLDITASIYLFIYFAFPVCFISPLTLWKGLCKRQQISKLKKNIQFGGVDIGEAFKENRISTQSYRQIISNLNCSCSTRTGSGAAHGNIWAESQPVALSHNE